MSVDSSSNQERPFLSLCGKDEVKRKTRILDVKLKKIGQYYEADERLLIAKRKQLQEVETEYESLEKHQRDEEESLATLEDSVRFMREENERLAAEVMRNDHLLRFGPNMGTLALRIKRAADSRNYTELQRGATEARQEVNALDFHLRNEEARLLQAQKDTDKVADIPNYSKTDLYYRAKQASALKEKLQNSRFRIKELARQKLEVAKQEDQLDAKIRELHDLLNSRHQR